MYFSHRTSGKSLWQGHYFGLIKITYISKVIFCEGVWECIGLIDKSQGHDAFELHCVTMAVVVFVLVYCCSIF